MTMATVQSRALILLTSIALLSAWRLVTALSSDVLALMAIKAAIVDNAGSLADWEESSSSPCVWKAIRCDVAGNVVSLNISGQNLTGSISGAIGSLKYLTTLAVDSNNFSGPLPQEVSQLTRLRFLNITENCFSSEFPSGLSNLSRLEVLDCYNNNLSGALPLSIVSLRNLQHVHIGGNNFMGSIPPEYGNFSSSLKYLALSGNALTGAIPPELGKLNGLNYLYLGWWNKFDGGIPPELGMMSTLFLLDLASCELEGPIPPELGNLTQLGSLFLYQNNLSGSLPPELGSLRNLQSLDISGNQFTGAVPEFFGGLKNLTLMSFFWNHFSGPLPAVLGDLPYLVEFQLWHNNFTGEIPQRMGTNGVLKIFDVSGNQLTGGLPPNLCPASKLEILIVMENFLSGPIPESLGSCYSLEKIRLGKNSFNGSVPPGIFSLPNVAMLQLNDNEFTGPLPSLIQSPALAFLDISRNQLSSEIPDAIGELAALLTFFARGNRFTGSIPSSICNIRPVYTIDLSENNISGEIPTALGDCTMLSMLDLSGNNLVGEIPTPLVNLSYLAVLNLSRNHLTGRIPPDFGLIPSLTLVDFSFNNLSGPVPVQGEAEFYNETVYEGNPFLCGGVLRSCSDVLKPNATSRSQDSLNDDPTLLLIGAVFSASLLVLIVGGCCFLRKHRYHIMRLLRRERAVRPWKLTLFQRLDFTANELVQCLCEENVIGKGGAGTVYKGQMSNGEMVAVKRLARGRGTSSHDHGFSAEIRTLGKIRHRYIVRLLGFCTNKEMNLLVYEYMPNGSLGEFLHGTKSGLLEWSTRYNVAVQAATGLCYLHHDCSPLIVHRDVKSNNILLDSELGARVADFGLAKLFQDTGSSESMSSVAGSYGYIAPEYAYTLKVNEKSDIYSFGVVLMELITGKRPIEPEFGDGVDIVQWVRTKIQTKEGVMDILDPRINSTVTPVPLQEVMLVLRVALLCSSDHPAERPTMRDVVQMLSDVRAGQRTSGSSMDSKELHVKPTQVLHTDDLLTF